MKRESYTKIGFSFEILESFIRFGLKIILNVFSLRKKKWMRWGSDSSVSAVSE